MTEISQKIMIFSKKSSNSVLSAKFSDQHLTFESDNVYQFLKYAKEIRPDIVIMNLPDGFDCTQKILEHFKENLCNENQCPKIYLNTPQNFNDNPFFYHVDFEGDSVDEDFVVRVLQHNQNSTYVH